MNLVDEEVEGDTNDGHLHDVLEAQEVSLDGHCHLQQLPEESYR